MKDELKKYLLAKIKPNEEQRSLSVRIPSELYLLAQKKSFSDNINFTQLIRGLLEFYVEEK